MDCVEHRNDRNNGGDEVKKENGVSRTLILDNGTTIKLDYPESIQSDVETEFENALTNGATWFCGNYMRLSATMSGERIDFINMKRVVGYR